MTFRISFLLLPLLPLMACQAKVAEYKNCAYQTSDTELQVYNDLLIELVEGWFYNLYLGERREELTKEVERNRIADSAQLKRFEQKAIELQHEQFGDTARFRIMYLAQKLIRKREVTEFLHNQYRTTVANKDNYFLNNFSTDSAAVVATLSEPQQKYKPEDFHACTFKVISLGKATSYQELGLMQKQRAIGQISFSEIYWNKQQTRGVLYYEFYCGGLCGKGEFIEFEKVDGHWKIVGMHQLFIS